MNSSKEEPLMLSGHGLGQLRPRLMHAVHKEQRAKNIWQPARADEPLEVRLAKGLLVGPRHRCEELQHTQRSSQIAYDDNGHCQIQFDEHSLPHRHMEPHIDHVHLQAHSTPQAARGDEHD